MPSYKEDEKLEEKISTEIIRRLLKYLLPYKKEVLLVLFLIGIGMVVDLLNPYFLKIAIDNYIKNKNLRGLFWVGIFVIVLNLTGAFASRMRTIKMSSVTNRALLNIRQDLF